MPKQSEKINQLELLNNVYEKLTDALSLKDTIKILNSIIKENLDCQHIDFIITSLDKKSDEYSFYAIQENGDLLIRKIAPEGIVNKAIKNKKTIALQDVTSDKDYIQYRKNIKSELAIPIFYKSKVIGCINLEFEKRQEFDKETLTTLEIIAKSIGSNLRNAILHEELQSSEDKFRQLVEHMNEGIWVGDENHNTVYVNPKFTEMTGIPYEECLKKICWAFYDEESQKRIHEQHGVRKEGKASQYELTVVRPDGTTVPVLCSGAPIPGGTVGIFTDLRALKEKENQLREITKLEKMLANISDSSIDAIFSMDKNLILQTWNKGAVKMFGYSKEEAIGQNVKFLYPTDKLQQGELEYLVKTALEKGFVRNYETVRINKSGKEIDVSISVTKLTDDKEKFIGLGGIYRDITYQKKAEKELQLRFESMQNAYMELGRQRRELDYLLDTLNIAIGDEQFSNVENYIVNAAMMLTKANGATLRIYNEKDKNLYLKAASGVQPEWWGKAKSPFQGSLIEEAFINRMPLFIDDIQNNPRYSSPKLAAEHGFVSSLVIPLYVKGKILGGLSLYSSNKNKLHLLDNSFIANFGKQASLAIFTQLSS